MKWRLQGTVTGLRTVWQIIILAFVLTIPSGLATAQEQKTKQKQRPSQSQTKQKPQKKGSQSQSDAGPTVEPTPSQVYMGWELRVIELERTWFDYNGRLRVFAAEGEEFIVVRIGIEPPEPKGYGAFAYSSKDLDPVIAGSELLDDKGNRYKCMKKGDFSGSVFLGSVSFTLRFSFRVPKNPSPKFKTLKIKELSFDIEKLALKAQNEQQPMTAEEYLKRGVAYYKEGELDRAIQYVTQAISLNPKLARAYQSRAEAYRKLGKTDLADADEKKAQELSGKRP